MTYPTLSLTESQTFQALRTVLLTILPSGIEVIRAQDNRVPEPEGNDFVTMTPIHKARLGNNVSTYTDLFSTGGASTKALLQPTGVDIQLDVHGPNSSDNAQLITTLLKDQYATDQFALTGFDVAPLYTSEPRQIPFSDGEQQIEERWVIDVTIQSNPVVTISQQFASSISIVLEPVEKLPN